MMEDGKMTKNPLTGFVIFLSLILTASLISGSILVLSFAGIIDTGSAIDNITNVFSNSKIPPELVGNWSDKNYKFASTTFPDPWVLVINQNGTYEKIVLQVSVKLNEASYYAKVEEGKCKVTGNTLTFTHTSDSDKVYTEKCEIVNLDNTTLQINGVVERTLTKIDKAPSNADAQDELKKSIEKAERALKRILKDPSSLQIHEIRYSSSDIYFDYSAKNSFGGYIRALAKVDADGNVLSTSTDSTNYDKINVILVETGWKIASIYEEKSP